MKTITLELDGGRLVLGPMLAVAIRDNREAIGKARKNELAPDELLDLTCKLAHACASRVDASITLDAVERLVDLANFGRVFAACWGASIPEPAPGEAEAVQEHIST